MATEKVYEDTDSAYDCLDIQDRFQTDSPQITSGPGSEGRIHREVFTPDRLELIGIIGCGGHGIVRLALDVLTNQVVVVKETAKSSLGQSKYVSQGYREKTILGSVQHPLVVEMYGAYQDCSKLYVVMEYLPGGDLGRLISPSSPLSVQESRFYVTEVTAVLLYLHRQGVVYRDLKPENVVIGSSGRIKVVDFGCAKRLKYEERTFTLCGTPEYLAPEILHRNGHSFAVDWWALGIFLHELLTGTTPFIADTPSDIYTNILTQTYVPPPDLDEPTKSLLAGLLSKDPGLRLTGDTLKAHRYFSGVDWEQLHLLSPPFLPEHDMQGEIPDFSWVEDSADDSVDQDMQAFVRKY